MKHILASFFLFLVTLSFFWQFLFKGLLPIPSDTIIGLYHPFRDLYSVDYPNGIPFKNFLITDPVRQQYPWRDLSINILKRFELPLWNPYNFSGTALFANFQSASLYPLNILFFIIPFNYAWSILIFLQPLLAGLFLYLYLKNIGVEKIASFLGAIVFSFSGFSIAWMEWGTILHVGLWLPLLFLSIDKIFFYFQNNSKLKTQNSKLNLKSKNLFFWAFIFTFSLISAFFAGHLQTFFYLFIITTVYFVIHWIQVGKKINILFLFIILNSLFIIFTFIQWIPTLQFILQSARDVDQSNWQKDGWFIPWQHLIQFIAPDFFGNPTTLNYWGVWNYAEFVGYIGILPLILSIFALFFRHDKKTLFFGIIFFLSLLFSLPTFIAKLPYILSIPFLSTAQPTRLLVITDFALAVLVALGFDYFLKTKERKIIYPISFIGVVVILMWVFVLTGNKIINNINLADILVSKQNSYFPTVLFFVSTILILILLKLSSKHRFTIIISIIIVALVIFDLFRFGWKFTPFTKKEYLFPNTKAIKFLRQNIGNFRVMTIDSRILPPNFSSVYKLQSIDGYDPLFLKKYAELIAASERGKPDISTPFGFNRIITPHNYNSKIIDLLGVKYILSLSDIDSQKLKKVFQEGETRIYENKNVLPRAFFVKGMKVVDDKQETIKSMFIENFDLGDVAIVENFMGGEDYPNPRWNKGKVEILNYSENKIIIEADNKGEGFLVLTDTFYPTWKAKVDGKETKIYRVDYNFRGIAIHRGKHMIEFYVTLF